MITNTKGAFQGPHDSEKAIPEVPGKRISYSGAQSSRPLFCPVKFNPLTNWEWLTYIHYLPRNRRLSRDIGGVEGTIEDPP